jgi:hypothetical protein
MDDKQYRAIDVWVRKESTIVRYRCFQVLPREEYCVQSADYYRPPFNDVKAAQLDKQFLELLSEQAPDSRSDLFSSLTEAINAFDRDFTNGETERS